MHKIILLVISLICICSCKSNNQSKPPYLEEAKALKIDSLANRYLELNRFSGTILVAKNGSEIYNENFGFADYENNIEFSSNTAFKIGEITELVTANIIHGLVKERKINLSDSISKYILEVNPDRTIGELLDKKSENDFNILGKLIEKVSNRTYQQNIESYSKELELENTFFENTDSSLAVGYLYHNYRGEGLELQKSPTYNREEAFSSKGLKSTAKDLLKIINSNPKEMNIHGYLENDGFSYSLVHDENDTISIIVLSNRKHPVTGEISNSISSILDGKKYKLPLRREPFNIDKILLKDFAGSYSLNESMNFEIIDSNDSLYVVMGGNKIFLVPQSESNFYMEQADASMKFMRDSTGIVNRIMLLNGFIDSDQIANKIE